MAIGTFNFRAVLPAAGSNQNILTPSTYEWLAGPTGVRLYGVADVTDTLAATNPVLVNFLLGQASIMQDFPLPLFTAGLGPNRQDHLLHEIVGQGGSRVIVALRNTDAANTRAVRIMIEFK